MAWCLQERDAKGPDSDTKPGHLIPEGGCFDATLYENHGQDSRIKEVSVAPQLNAKAGTGGGNLPLVGEPLGFDRAQITSDKNYSNPKPGDPQPPLNTAAQGMVAQPSVYSPVDYANGRYEERPVTTPVTTPVTASRDPSRATPLAVDGQPFALSIRGREGGAAAEVEKDGIAPVLRNSAGGGGHHTFVAAPSPTMRVRRLTPQECERLMAFPDGYTAIPWKGKPAESCPDGPRYRALGNSMVTSVVAWIGRRIQMVEELA